MFRSPLTCSSEHVPFADSFNKFMTAAIEQELRPYFIEDDGYDQITAADGNVLNYCRITEKELSLVDRDRLAKLFPPEISIFLPDFYIRLPLTEELTPEEERFSQEEFAENTKTFWAKKFLQIVKLLKDEKEYTPDLMMETMICTIAGAVCSSGECVYDGKDDLVRSVISFYIDEDGQDDEYAEEMRATIMNAAYNLHAILQAEQECGIRWILWDADYTYLLDGDYAGLQTLLAFGGGYSDYYMRSIYVSVDECVPFAIEAALDFRKKVASHIPDIEKEVGESILRAVAGSLFEDEDPKVIKFDPGRYCGAGDPDEDYDEDYGEDDPDDDEYIEEFLANHHERIEYNGGNEYISVMIEEYEQDDASIISAFCYLNVLTSAQEGASPETFHEKYGNRLLEFYHFFMKNFYTPEFMEKIRERWDGLPRILQLGYDLENDAKK